MARDPYQELGVSRAATADEIRKAFRKLAKANHPDTNPGNKEAEERFKRVSAAFDIIGDPEKRKKFDAGEIDAEGRETFRGFGGAGGAGGPWGPPPGGGFGGRGGGYRSETFEGVDLGDILGEMFGGGGRGGRGGGAGGGFGGFSQRGADVRAKLEIDLIDAIRGGKRRIAFSDGRTVDVTIPKGAQEGQTLRLRGQGAPGRSGPGDAFIELTIQPHPVFRREGEVLVMDLPVTLYDAVLGGKVEAPTPDGPVTLTIPKGSNTGAKLRLKGKGLTDAQGRRGDLFARLVVALPDAPDPALEMLAEDMRKSRPYTPRRRG
ncbi:dnaJ-class molecular chaperone [Phenylobacterium zucineum HLK1]|uniref:DnaJ-class molecular chaperone n=1 Tax=Phenylobacterium zucineum (strain HLK1) TaxID=450851 RepID=B4RHR6_PHEZH|nr:DnaJ C-terminal domain-containing protein [Phenylobacterium zucineum]ACG79107.1 dnaJ-class molecular chaperone [Phenylobacterium zucineum HLK1]